MATCAARPLACGELRQVPDQSVGDVHRRRGDAARRHAELAPAASGNRSVERVPRPRCASSPSGGAVANARPAPASPSVPVTANRSPALRPAPAQRRTARNVPHDLHADGQGTAGRVAAHQRRPRARRQDRRNPAENRSSQATSALGNVSASVAHAGVAPMAAMSLKLTASARWPMERASVPCGKWRPATMVSTAATNSRLRRQRRAAPHRRRCRASTPGRGRAPRGAEKKRRISSNSPRWSSAFIASVGSRIRAAAIPARPGPARH